MGIDPKLIGLERPDSTVPSTRVGTRGWKWDALARES
jgi:hypothetical protein